MPELDSFLTETYKNVIEQLSNQKEILGHVVERLDSLITTISIKNERFSSVIETMSHNIPEQIKESLNTCNQEAVKVMEEISNRIKTLKEGFDAGFLEGTKEMEKMKNRINFLYAAFAIVVMQLVAILVKIWL